jgi:hypothetical protein
MWDHIAARFVDHSILDPRGIEKMGDVSTVKTIMQRLRHAVMHIGYKLVGLSSDDCEPADDLACFGWR